MYYVLECVAFHRSTCGKIAPMTHPAYYFIRALVANYVDQQCSNAVAPDYT